MKIRRFIDRLTISYTSIYHDKVDKSTWTGNTFPRELTVDPLAFLSCGLLGSWWRHQIETFSALLASCAGNSPLTDESHTKASDGELWCLSESFCTSFKNSIIDQSDPDTVARKLDQYISQACKRTFEQNKYMNKRNRKFPVWYDAECRNKRSLAIKAGERVTNAFEKGQQDMACREYRACKQRKERGYYRNCVNDIKIAYATDRSNLWKMINTIVKANGNGNEPEDCEFYHHFKGLSSPNPTEYLNPEYESIAI